MSWECRFFLTFPIASSNAERWKLRQNKGEGSLFQIKPHPVIWNTIVTALRDSCRDWSCRSSNSSPSAWSSSVTPRPHLLPRVHLAAATATTERQEGGVSPVLWPEMTLALLKFINGLKDTIVSITVHVHSNGKCGLKTCTICLQSSGSLPT